MIKLGVNSILHKDFDFATAAKYIAQAGYDGVSISAIQGNCEHLELDRWKKQASELKAIVANYGLEFLAMEVSLLSEERLKLAFEACGEFGISIVNVGPGGNTGSSDDVRRSIELLEKMSEKAASYSIALCVKAHQGHSIYNSETLLQAVADIRSDGFGVDLDPSHLYRAGEDPVQVLPRFVNRVKHVHIRDCRDRSQGGSIIDQTCGRGYLDLHGICKQLVDSEYNGPMNLEIIGANGYSLDQVVSVASESYGYLNACLKSLNAR